MNVAVASSPSVVIRLVPTAVVQTLVTPPPDADVAITKTGPARVNPDGTITYLLTVINHGPVPAANVVVRDPVSQVTVISVPGNCSSAGGTVECRLGTMAVGVPEVIQVTARANHDAGRVIHDCAVAYTTTDDPHPENNQSCIDTIVGPGIPPTADLVVTKDAPRAASPGGTVTYTISVTNRGPGNASDVLVQDPVDEPSVAVSALPADCSLADGTVTCHAASLNVGETKTFLITVTVGSRVSIGTRIDDCAAAGSAATLLREPGLSWCVETDVVRTPPPPTVPVTG